MRCPKCQHEQPNGSAECVRCGVVFAKWRPVVGRDVPGMGAPPLDGGDEEAPGRPGAARAGGLPGWAKVLVFLAVGAAWYWFLAWAPAGLPLPANARADAGRSFALVAPEAWTVQETPSCEPVGSALTAATACVALVVRRDANAPGPSVQVLTVPIGTVFKTGWRGSVRITDDDVASMAQTFESAVAAQVPQYVSEARLVTPVDRIPALHVRGSSTVKGTPVFIGDKMVTIPNLTGPTPERHLTMGHVLVPGGTTLYVISYSCDTAEYPGYAATFNGVIESFRLTRGRPTAFQSTGGLGGSIKGDAILGLLVGLTLAAVKFR